MRVGAVVMTLALAGCASSGPVPVGKDTFMVTKQSAGGTFVSTGSIKADLIREAAAFCASTGKAFQIVNTREVPPAPMRMPSAEVYFMCLNESDPDHTRTRLTKAADAVVEVRTP